jgi:hypothetical protein
LENTKVNCISPSQSRDRFVNHWHAHECFALHCGYVVYCIRKKMDCAFSLVLFSFGISTVPKVDFLLAFQLCNEASVNLIRYV